MKIYDMTAETQRRTERQSKKYFIIICSSASLRWKFFLVNYFDSDNVNSIKITSQGDKKFSTLRILDYFFSRNYGKFSNY